MYLLIAMEIKAHTVHAHTVFTSNPHTSPNQFRGDHRSAKMSIVYIRQL